MSDHRCWHREVPLKRHWLELIMSSSLNLPDSKRCKRWLHLIVVFYKNKKPFCCCFLFFFFWGLTVKCVSVAIVRGLWESTKWMESFEWMWFTASTCKLYFVKREQHSSRWPLSTQRAASAWKLRDTLLCYNEVFSKQEWAKTPLLDLLPLAPLSSPKRFFAKYFSVIVQWKCVPLPVK